MKVNRIELLNELKKVSKMTGSSGTMEMVRGVLIEYANSQLSLSATNLATSIICKIDCETDMTEKESLVVDAKLLHDIVAKLSGDDVSFDYKEDATLHIKGGGSKFNIKAMGKKSDFPEIELSGGDKKSIVFDTSVIMELVNKTVLFTSEDVARPLLKGVCITLSKDKIVGASLDGYRLAHYVADCGCEEEAVFIINGGELNKIGRIMEGETVTVSYEDNIKSVEFTFSNTSIICKTLEGEFFKYNDMLMPDDAPTTLQISAKAFKNAVDRATIMAKSNNSMSAVKLSMDGDNLVINCNTDIGAVEEKVEVISVEGEKIDFTIGFNPKYLLEGLNSMVSDELEFKLKDRLSPTYIIDKEIGFTYLVLPIRLAQDEE